MPDVGLPFLKDTVVRSVRISKEMDRLLHEEMKERGVNFNALIQSLLTKYFEFDRFAEKFSMVVIPAELFSSLFDALDDEKIREVALKAARLMKATIMFWFKQVDLEKFLAFFLLGFKYALGRHANYDLKTEGKNYLITIHHDLGEKWGAGFEYLWRESFKELVGINADFERRVNYIEVKFTAP